MSVLLAAMVLAPGHSFSQPIYKWKDEKGQWHFSHTPPPGTKTEVVGEDKPRPPEIFEPAKEEPKASNSGLVIQDAGISFNGEHLDIEGKVKNVSDKFERNVQVEARVWNEKGNVVGTARVETKPKDLKPGETGSFAFRIAAKDGAKVTVTTRDSKKTLIVAGRPSLKVQPPGFEGDMDTHRARLDEDTGGLNIVGYVLFHRTRVPTITRAQRARQR